MKEEYGSWCSISILILFICPLTYVDGQIKPITGGRHERMIMEVVDMGLLLLDILTTATQYIDSNQVEEYMDNTPQEAHLITQMVKNSVIQAKEQSQLKSDFDKLTKKFRKIDLYYMRYKQLKISKLSAHNWTMSSFINQMLDLNHGLIDILDSINSMILTPQSKLQTHEILPTMLIDGFLSRLQQHTKSYENVCDRHKSQQQMFLVLLSSFVNAESKGLLVLEFCYKKLAEIGQVNYKVEHKNMLQLLERRMYNMTSDFELYLRYASRDVWRCDPPKDDKGSSYVEFEGLFQKYVAYEQALVNYTMKDGKIVHTTEGTCDNTCTDYKNAVTLEDDCVDIVVGRRGAYKWVRVSCPTERRCTGSLHDCERLGNEPELWTCPTDSSQTRRRYEAIVNEGKGGTFYYGPAIDYCWTYPDYSLKTYTGFWYFCDICVCTCHDLSDSYYVNMREAIADPDHVITGVRLVKEGYDLHIQIQQGLVSKKGHIMSGTVHWKNISYPKSENEYRTFNWLDTRKIYLGIDELPDQQVLTGLKFVFMKNGPREYILGFETSSKWYDRTTGELEHADNEQNVDRFYESPIPPENELSVDDANIQSNSYEPSVPQPDYVMTVKLTTSSLRNDMGQSTIPFIDIQPVITDPPMPLSGAGFYLKNTEGHGGYLGVMIRTLDLSSYLSRPQS